jgi:ferritin-like protein
MPEHANLHEPAELLSQAVIERHRALVSLMEELEAVDWYDQRVEASTDAGIREVMAHNRDEEKEHAAMTLEWLRRNDAKWDEVLRTYLFTELPITEVEAEAEGRDGDSDGPGGTSGAGALAIGDLRREPTR